MLTSICLHVSLLSVAQRTKKREGGYGLSREYAAQCNVVLAPLERPGEVLGLLEKCQRAMILLMGRNILPLKNKEKQNG